jgi:hypothetical protein
LPHRRRIAAFIFLSRFGVDRALGTEKGQASVQVTRRRLDEPDATRASRANSARETDVRIATLKSHVATDAKPTSLRQIESEIFIQHPASFQSDYD